MAEHLHAAQGRAVLRSAPWPVLLPFTVVAAAFYAVAILARNDALGLLLALVAIATCGAVAGYVLDEEAREVADATPAARPLRAAWRVMIVVLPGLVTATALIWVDLLAPTAHARRLLPIGAGSIALGLAMAAVMRSRGNPAPGDLAGVLTFGTVVLAVQADPLRRWVSLSGLATHDYPLRTGLTWVVLVGLCVLTFLASERDPGSGRRGHARRKERT